MSADKRIRYRPRERSAICVNAARCVTFAAGDLTADQMIALVLRHLARLTFIAGQPGPYVYHLTSDRLHQMDLDCTDIDRPSDVPAG